MDIAISDTNLIQADNRAEADLVERAKNDRKAFATLYRTHYSSIAGYLYRRTGDAHIAEDLVSEVFIAVLRHLPNYKQRNIPFKYWLYRIATNTANRWAKKHKRLAKNVQYQQELIDHVSENDRKKNPESQRAIRALLQLSPNFQSVLALYHIEELSIEQISLVLNCKPGTVKSRLSRAREALRFRLKQELTSNE